MFKLLYDYRYPLNPINQNPQPYLPPSDVQTMVQSDVEPQFEKSYVEENYPERKEVMQSQLIIN